MVAEVVLAQRVELEGLLVDVGARARHYLHSCLGEDCVERQILSEETR